MSDLKSSVDFHEVDRVLSHRQDLPVAALSQAREMGLAAVDIETSGLDWKNEQIGSCQVYIPHNQPYFVKIEERKPENILELIKDDSVLKVFHHAMFDLRFMAYNWDAVIRRVACTKIASKIANPNTDGHSLKVLISNRINRRIDKSFQTSDWMSDSHSSSQLLYATRDVLYLPFLFFSLTRELESKDRLRFASASFDYLPTRVALDILEAGDVFKY